MLTIIRLGFLPGDGIAGLRWVDIARFQPVALRAGSRCSAVPYLARGVPDLSVPLCSVAPAPAVSKKLLLMAVFFQRAHLSGTRLRPGPDECAVKLLDTYLLQLIIYDYK